VPVGGIVCDLSKAFDCVNHRILLSKLEHYGIRGTFGTLIKSYLMERYKRAAIKDKTNTTNYSKWELLRHGVPQSSILNLLLFIFYIYLIFPIVTAKNAKLVLYANDTSFIIINPNPTEFANKLNKIFVEVTEWFRNNLQFLNLNKTTYLQFRTKKSQKLDLNITLLNNQITNSTNTKFLGLTTEEKLLWKCHINQILLRMSLACYAIKVSTHLTSEYILKMI
jgi:hypothetical protein